MANKFDKNKRAAVLKALAGRDPAKASKKDIAKQHGIGYQTLLAWERVAAGGAYQPAASSRRATKGVRSGGERASPAVRPRGFELVAAVDSPEAVEQAAKQVEAWREEATMAVSTATERAAELRAKADRLEAAVKALSPREEATSNGASEDSNYSTY